ncbi:MAG TPA: hypothetical protein VJ250_01435 [Nitrososphaeraceae archaeon]|nr:hypothetical protein [Nitrososphaeraceae archaeon]
MVPIKRNHVSQVIETNSEFLGDGLYETNFDVCRDDKSVLLGIVKPIIKEVQIKPSARRIDYNFFNYCSSCELKYPKQVLRCKDCNQKVRTRPWHRSKIVDRKRI